MNEQVGVPARREALGSLEIMQHSHAGLALQRYLKGHKSKQRDNTGTMPEEALLNAVVERVEAPEVYQSAFRRWQQWVSSEASDRACVQFTLQAAAPIAIGLGNASPLEIGITVHHTYGMPIIPGSALKGLCRRGARLLVKEGKLQQSAFDYLFGTGGKADAAAGAVVFYDAWYDPSSVKGKPFHRDVITVHHPQYYGSRGKIPPTDFDDPNPVPFLVVKPGAQFFFALAATSKEWAEFAQKLLVWCLANLGVGAKTNAGYGYFAIGASTARPAQQADTSQAHDVVWEGSLVKWLAGQQQFRATNPQNPQQYALLSGAEAKKLYDSLPSPIQDSLKSKGIKTQVKLKKLGNQLIIVQIQLQEM
jgi:CRISPR-associated protein Cmr6